MDRRREPRVTTVLPVRVWGIDAYDQGFTQIVSARNVSAEGALLDGLRHRIRMGETLELQYGGRKAEFRVVWISESSDGLRTQVGIKTLPSEDCIWDLKLEQCSEFVGNG
ncbi:MAG TPA: PilZ domain-containing protein [Terriglobales bacterium]|nr:PilZ domain-containing protein [Terriglobales bacterium]